MRTHILVSIKCIGGCAVALCCVLALSVSCSPPVAAVGACCTNGTCTEVSAQVCADSNGTYQGDSTTCATDGICSPMGACCTQIGCSERTEQDCADADGDYEGDGTLCGPGICGQSGAFICCFGEECDAFLLSQVECMDFGGTPVTGLTTCEGDPCRTAACCTATGCSVMIEQECLDDGGNFMANSQTCDPDPCP